MISLREYISKHQHKGCCIVNHMKCVTHEEITGCRRCEDEKWLDEVRAHIEQLVTRKRLEASDSIGVRERNTSLRVLADLILGEKETRKCLPGGRL